MLGRVHQQPRQLLLRSMAWARELHPPTRAAIIITTNFAPGRALAGPTTTLPPDSRPRSQRGQFTTLWPVSASLTPPTIKTCIGHAALSCMLVGGRSGGGWRWAMNMLLRLDGCLSMIDCTCIFFYRSLLSHASCAPTLSSWCCTARMDKHTDFCKSALSPSQVEAGVWCQQFELSPTIALSKPGASSRCLVDVSTCMTISPGLLDSCQLATPAMLL